jgi:hypothetical protein
MSDTVTKIELDPADFFCLKSAREWVRGFARSGEKPEGKTQGTTPQNTTFSTPKGDVVLKKISSIPGVREPHWELTVPPSITSKVEKQTGGCVANIDRKPAALEALAITLAITFEKKRKLHSNASRMMDRLTRKHGVYDGMAMYAKAMPYTTPPTDANEDAGATDAPQAPKK